MPENNQEQNPFEEEFDRSDVVESLTDDELDEKEEKPFSEEFDSKDVVGNENEDEEDEPVIMPSDIGDMDAPLAEEVETVSGEDLYDEVMEEMDMTESERLQKNFEDEYGVMHRKPEDDMEHSQSNFEDFMVVPKIAGSNNRMPKSNLYPSETIESENMKVEIADDPILEDDEKRSSVIVNRTPEGEVESIEVVCSCGEKTLIKLDYSDMGGEKVTQIVDQPGSQLEIEQESPESPADEKDAEPGEPDEPDAETDISDEEIPDLDEFSAEDSGSEDDESTESEESYPDEPETGAIEESDINDEMENQAGEEPVKED